MIYKRKYFLKEDNGWTGVQGTSAISVLKQKSRDFISGEGKKKKTIGKQEEFLEKLADVFKTGKSYSDVATYVKKNQKALLKGFKPFNYVTPKFEVKEDGIVLYEMKNAAEIIYTTDRKLRYYINGFFDSEGDFVGYINKNNKVDKDFLKKVFSAFNGRSKDEVKQIEEEKEEALNDWKGQNYIIPMLESRADGKGIVLFKISANQAEVSYDFEDKSFLYYLDNEFNQESAFTSYIKKLGQKIDENLLNFTGSIITKGQTKKERPGEEVPAGLPNEDKKLLNSFMNKFFGPKSPLMDQDIFTTIVTPYLAKKGVDKALTWEVTLQLVEDKNKGLQALADLFLLVGAYKDKETIAEMEALLTRAKNEKQNK